MFPIQLNPQTLFLYSTSGSASSIEKHNKALQQLGLNLVYFTFPQDIDAQTYTGLLRSPIARGAAVTGKGGLKSNIIPFLDEVEPLAKKTLAVNTVVNQNGKLYGYNSDAIGLKYALEKGLKETEIKTAVIYGNGGVSGVAFHVLEELGIKTTMIGRSPERVLAKKKELGLSHKEHFEGPYDLVIDATPISSTPEFLDAPNFKALLNNCKMLFCHNMPEKDGKTNYLQAYCQQENIPYLPGKWMYNGQLLKQYRLLLEGFSTEGRLITDQDIIRAWGIE